MLIIGFFCDEFLWDELFDFSVIIGFLCVFYCYIMDIKILDFCKIMLDFGVVYCIL